MSEQTAVSPAMALRIAVYQAQPSPLVMSMSDQEIMHYLAEKLVQGKLVLSGNNDGAWPLPDAAADASAAAAAPAADTAPVVNLNTLPDPAEVPPLLPVLEEVQIEGAEVLPEVEQTLEQIDLTIGTIDTASVSLAPAPTKVQLVNTAMTDASAAVSKTLDEL